MKKFVSMQHFWRVFKGGQEFAGRRRGGRKPYRCEGTRLWCVGASQRVWQGSNPDVSTGSEFVEILISILYNLK